MALIVRIDVDRPYGRKPLVRHVLSRMSSDFYLPKIESFGYLAELGRMLALLNEVGARAYVFFRRCTLPSTRIMALLEDGHHHIAMHLEDSRSYESFLWEKQDIERHVGKNIFAVSKHGSGGAKYGRRHYAPYEPERYMEWAAKSGMKLFLGNLEDPTIGPVQTTTLLTFPSAFWFEPYWRDTRRFDIEWLIHHAQSRDIVLLVHPENVLAEPDLVADFRKLIRTLETRTFQ